MKKTITITIILCCIMIGLNGCESSSGSNLSSNGYNLTNNIYESSTEELTQVETTSGGGIVVPPDTSETSSVDIPVWDVLNNNTLDVSFKFEGETKNWFITAPITGNYRFSFDISDVNCSYNYRLSKMNHKEIKSGDNDSGFNIELTQGETYVLELLQRNGLPKCTIEIGVPNSPKIVDDNRINENIRFIGQKDTYNYTAPLSGKYGFHLDISNVEYSYTVKIVGTKNNVIAEEKYSQVGYKDYFFNADLEIDNKYSIIVYFDNYDLNDRDLEYTIDIYEPNEIESVTGNTVSGNFIFGGQQNRYIFTAPKTSTYLLEFNDSNEQLEYQISFCDEKNRLQEHKKNIWKVSFNLEKEMKYEITVSQNNNYGKYSFNIIEETSE